MTDRWLKSYKRACAFSVSPMTSRFLASSRTRRRSSGAAGSSCCPSRFEGTPNALLEAMACRTPCIVSDASPGPLCLIEHGATGLVVETGSVKGLADAMAKLSGDERMQRELGDAGFERVREFGLDRVGPIWDRILFPDDCPGIDVKP